MVDDDRYLVLEQELVPVYQDLPQPLQNFCPINYLLADEFTTDDEENLGAETKTGFLSLDHSEPEIAGFWFRMQPQ